MGLVNALNFNPFPDPTRSHDSTAKKMEAVDATQLETYKVADLKKFLADRALSTAGLKKDLVARLRQVLFSFALFICVLCGG